MRGVIYAHEILNPPGVKIGRSENYEARMSSYKTHGDYIKELCVVEVENATESEKAIHKALDVAGLRIKTAGEPGSEVFNVAPHQAVALLLSNSELIKSKNCDVIDEGESPHLSTTLPDSTTRFDEPPAALSDTLEWQVKEITIRDYIEMYRSGKIKKFKFQRDVEHMHMQNLKEYIRNNWYKKSFIFPPITLIGVGTFDILDGLHRTLALDELEICARLGEKSDQATSRSVAALFNYKIFIHIKNRNVDEESRLDIFRAINAGKPVDEIYLDDQTISATHRRIITELNARYPYFITNSAPNEIQITQSCIVSNFSRQNLVELLMSGVIKDTSGQDIVAALVDINNSLITLTAHYIQVQEVSLCSRFGNKLKKEQLNDLLHCYRSFNFEAINSKKKHITQVKIKSVFDELDTVYKSYCVARKKGTRTVIVRNKNFNVCMLGILNWKGNIICDIIKNKKEIYSEFFTEEE
jgi:hypothetical protein